jgi:hypothetical protein
MFIYGKVDHSKLVQSEKRINLGDHVCRPNGTKWRNFIEDLHRCFLPSFGSFDLAVSEEKIFKNRPIRNKNGLVLIC